nr:retrotransposon Gag domain, retroviral aspartyl protease [Tanacetum cinerariifolium]
MVTTRNTTSLNEQPNHNDTSSPLQNPDNLAQRLSSIASKLNALDTIVADVAVLKAQVGPNGSNRGKSATLGSRYRDDNLESMGWYRSSTKTPFTKMEFTKFEGGDPRGWILKAEKYFCYYETLDEYKVDIASMYLEGDAFDLFAWINAEHNHLYWKKLLKILHENYGPTKFQNPDEHLCNIKKQGPYKNTDKNLQKELHEFTTGQIIVSWVFFLVVSRKKLKVDVRIHKPRNVFKWLNSQLYLDVSRETIGIEGEYMWGYKFDKDTHITDKIGTHPTTKSRSRCSFRRPQHDDFLALAIPVYMDFLNLQDALLIDLYTKNIITSIRQDPTTHPEFSLSDNKLFYQNRLVIPDDSSLRKKILSECHDSLTGGHGGYLKTLKRLSENFFWPKDESDVKVLMKNFLEMAEEDALLAFQYECGVCANYSYSRGCHLRIKESLMVQDRDKTKGNSVDGPSVVNVVEHNNSIKYNDNKGKRVNVGTKTNGSGTSGLGNGSDA